MDPVSTKAAAGRQVRYRMTVFTTLAYETATNAVIAQNVKDERGPMDGYALSSLRSIHDNTPLPPWPELLWT
jgi:hypothetical protein